MPDPSTSPASQRNYGDIRFLIAGDRFVLVELGQKMDLAISIRAIQLADRLLQEKIPGVIETLPMFVSVLVHYDSLVLAPGRLKEVVFSIWNELSRDKEIVVRSRLIEIPVLYCDPWNKECVEEYSRTIHPMEDNPTFVARINGLSDINELVRLHSRSQYWVGGTGFYPGAADSIPLDPRSKLSVPKYNPPRMWTPPGAIGVGGGSTSLYPMRTPGGFYLIGRTPAPIYSLDTRLGPFCERATLLEAGDRIKFRAISMEEYEAIDADVSAGTYQYLIWDYELFSLRLYKDWADHVQTTEQ